MPTFVQILDFIGTFAFAISGIRLASAKRFDWFGAYVVGLRCTVGNDVRDWKDALACFFTHWDGDNGMKD